MRNKITPQNKKRVRRLRRQRRGMALLFVVSLILFITLLGTSFVVVSQQFAKSANIRVRIDARGDSSRTVLQRAFYDLMRGPTADNLKSPLRGGHDLMADMYGYGFSAEVTDDADHVAAVFYVSPQAPGEYDVPGAIEFTLYEGQPTPFIPTSVENLRPVSEALGETPPTPQILSDVPGAYNGRVLTFVSGALAGTSVRIIGYSGLQNGFYTNQPKTFIAYPEQSRDVPATFMDQNMRQVADIRGAQVVMNGRAYFGWGAGGNSGGNLTDAALAPNRTLATTLPLDDFNSTGVNESYDAPDYQNMFLASMDSNGGNVIASFEREGLAAMGGNFRAFGSVGDALDVDNDADGTEDSIWIDPGYPVQTSIDGRRYKTLVAYMVLDMDARFNVNAHGDLFDFDNNLNRTDTLSLIQRGLYPSGGATLLGGIDATIALPFADAPNGLPHGQYLGPPEISMAPIFRPATPSVPPIPGSSADDDNNGVADYQEVVESRYGIDAVPGVTNYRDAWQKYIQFGHPDLFHADESYPNQFVGGLYGTPLDIHGRYMRGIPFYSGINVPTQLATNDELTRFDVNTEFEIADSAYEFSLLSQSRYTDVAANWSDDSPFSHMEIERILRPYDRDSQMLPSRLSKLIGNRDLRRKIGAGSFETPALPALPRVAAIDGPGSTGVTLNQRAASLINAQTLPVPTTAQLSASLEELLSYELRMGLPFDLNRPFGDGRDNDGDGIYDEFDELMLGNETLTRVDGSTVNMNLDEYSRFAFAKQLYTLLLLVTGDTVDIAPVVTVGAGGLTDQDTIRRLTLAQWAINVVDFRDSDSIYTPFEFDFNPFDGWDTDGDLSTVEPGGDRMVVWGTERPELLLTENVAFHDRRAQDLMAAGGGDTSSGDDDFDSRLVPNASVFFELYRPWSQSSDDQLNPRELGATDTEDGINLLQTTTTGGHPVWRMVVAAESFPIPGTPPGSMLGGNLSTRHRDVNGVHANTQAIPELAQRRRIYFVEPDMTVEPAGNRRKVYWPGPTVQGQLAGNTFIQPGGYAVIGSAGTATGGAYDTWFGRRTEADWDTRMDATRGISLLPGSQQVVVREGTPEAVAMTRDAVAIPIDTTEDATGTVITRPLGLSDPLNGYYDYAGMSDVTPVVDGFEFTSTRDIPIDSDPATWVDEPDRLLRNSNGMTQNFRSVFLQRLADPTQPFDTELNPYLTIDAQYIDLTVFNGAADDSGEALVSNTNQVFASVERGRFNNPTLSALANADVTKRRRLWPIDFTEEVTPQPPLVGDTHHFNQNFIGSPGTLNVAYDHLDFQAPDTAPVGFAGLTWNNRPFASHMELLDVPYTHSADLLSSPDSLSGIGPTIASPGGYTLYRLETVGDDPADPQIPGPVPIDNPYPVRGGQFGHLLNFFADGTEDDAAGALGTEPGNLIALLDFVRVPSRFAGTRIHLDSQTLAPPFNVISRYREPGKININTVVETDVMQGWLGQIGQPFTVEGFYTDNTPATFTNTGVSTAIASAFETSRRNAAMDEFDNPYRNAYEYDKVPVSNVVAGAVSKDSSLMRIAEGGVTAVFHTTGDLPWADSDRESTSHFETFRCIGSTTTTRSSVFAIWVTVGKFEVDENGSLVTTSAGSGVEIGESTGKAKRSRGFYIIDRSIPVGFEPGKNHNVEDLILVESIID